MRGLLLSLLVVSSVSCDQAPGVEWSEDWVDKIRGKIEFLWDRRKFLAGKFNIDSGPKELTRWVLQTKPPQCL